MANLDSRQKRASSVSVLAPYNLALLLPDGTIATVDRQQIAWCYAGIAAEIAEPFAPSGTLRWVQMYFLRSEGHYSSRADQLYHRRMEDFS